MPELAELNAQEKAKPYAKYYYQTPAAPDPKLLAVMENPMDPAKALPFENLNDLLDPGYHEVESGWCILPNGAGYIANHTKMAGVSVDMLNWWFAWHSLEDLRYKIWWPAGHFGISVNDADRAKVLDPKRSPTEKFQGLTHHVLEDVGGPGVEKIAISFLTPQDCGFDMNRFKSPAVGTLVAANGLAQPIDPPPGVPDVKAPAFMCHFIREIEGGIEFRTRFWMGYHIIDKKPKLLLPPGVKVPAFMPQGIAMHNIYEYTNLASFLPQIYIEQQGLVA
jgi:phloretin hydrolase